MLRNNDYTTGNLLDNLYHQKHHKRIVIDLSRPTNMSISQPITFVGKLEEDHSAIMFFVSEAKQKDIQIFSLDSSNVTNQYNNGTSKSVKLIEWSRRFYIRNKKMEYSQW